MFRSIVVALCLCTVSAAAPETPAKLPAADQAVLARALHLVYQDGEKPRIFGEFSVAELDGLMAEMTPVYRRNPEATYQEGNKGVSARWILLDATRWRMIKAATLEEKARAAEAGLRALAPDHEMEVGYDPRPGFIQDCRRALVAAHKLRPDEISVFAEWKWFDRPAMVRQDLRGDWYIRQDLCRELTRKPAPAAPAYVDRKTGKRFLLIKALPKELMSVDNYDPKTQILTLVVPPLRASDPSAGA